jgi:hypothetical protein
MRTAPRTRRRRAHELLAPQTQRAGIPLVVRNPGPIRRELLLASGGRSRRFESFRAYTPRPRWFGRRRPTPPSGHVRRPSSVSGACCFSTQRGAHVRLRIAGGSAVSALLCSLNPLVSGGPETHGT